MKCEVIYNGFGLVDREIPTTHLEWDNWAGGYN
jgi:hypothetical protein